MKISYNRLKNYIHTDKSAEDLGHILTACGLEVEGIEKFEAVKGGLKGVIIGEVLTCEKHPDADKLKVTTVDLGENEPVQIVCGAPNVAQGQKVPVATIGTILYPEGAEDGFKIKKSKIRGQVSMGMICAEDELGLGTSHDGIMVLDTDLPNGSPLTELIALEEDYIIEIGITPNRADAISHYGTARDLAVLFDQKIDLPSVDNFKIDNHSLPIEVTVESPEACPRYSGVTISGVIIKESPDWLKRFLLSLGLTPINNVVDITNFILHDLGQPLHAFDADKIANNHIIVKTLPQNTPFVTLDEQERKLAENDLMICDGNQKPMCIGGVFGGIESGVTEKTTKIFLEAAYFNPIFIRKTSQIHTLKTDASFRFERGTDPNATIYALKRAALLIQELAGGEISSDIVDIYPEPIPNFELSVRYQMINRLIGQDIPKETVKKILIGLEIDILEETAESLKISVPPYRVDVQREADVIEEILRIYGYDNIEMNPHLSSSFLADFPAKTKDNIRMQITHSLTGRGFSEIMTNSLTKSAYSASMESLGSKSDVVILNKLSEDLDVMRQSLLFTGLEVLSRNINRQRPDLKLFEFGSTYHKVTKNDDTIHYDEHENLALFLTGNQTLETWKHQTQQTDFHDLAGVVLDILKNIGITDFKQQNSDYEGFTGGLSILVNKKEVAKIGLLKKSILKPHGIKQAVFYAELDWENLLKINKKIKLSFSDLPRFPEVRRDLSLVVNQSVTYDEIVQLAQKTERRILQSINVFSVYEGQNLGKGKKSYAVSFILQDHQKTLTDKVIDKTMKRLISAYERQLQAIIRK